MHQLQILADDYRRLLRHDPDIERVVSVLSWRWTPAGMTLETSGDAMGSTMLGLVRASLAEHGR